MSTYRARFDATVTFTNGGGLQAEGFLVDLPSSDTTAEQIGRLFLDSLGLLMAAEVELTNLEIIEAPHKGTRGGPADQPHPDPTTGQAEYVELSHVIRDGMVTLPNLPGPELSPHLTREASRQVYAPGTEFEIGRISMVANTGTYLDSPYHRYPDGHDLTGYAIAQTTDLPAIVVRVEDSAKLGTDVAALAPYDVTGKAVLLHTGDDARFDTPQYVEDAHFLTRDGAHPPVPPSPRTHPESRASAPFQSAPTSGCPDRGRGGGRSTGPSPGRWPGGRRRGRGGC
jgi:arylformamidase